MYCCLNSPEGFFQASWKAFPRCLERPFQDAWKPCPRCLDTLSKMLGHPVQGAWTLLPSTFVNHAADFVIEVVLLHQVFQCEVHAPAPVVVRIGGDVDALDVNVRIA